MFQLLTLGGFRTRIDERLVCPTIGKASQKLLVYLLLHNGQVVSKAKIVDLFFSTADFEKAALALNTAIWRLKKWNNTHLRHFDSKIISMRGEVAVEVGDTSFFDHDEFQRLSACDADGEISPSQSARLLEAKKLYRGNFLEGEKDLWVLGERDRLRRRYLYVMELLMEHFLRQGRYEAALDLGRSILQADPLREKVHRNMMLLYALDGQRAAALSQFDECRDTMAKWGLAPMREIFELIEEVRKGAVGGPGQHA